MPLKPSKKLRESTILLVGRPMQPIEPVITRTLGTKVVPIDFKQLDRGLQESRSGAGLRVCPPVDSRGSSSGRAPG